MRQLISKIVETSHLPSIYLKSYLRAMPKSTPTISICIPTARSHLSKRGTLENLVQPSLHRLPIKEVLVFGQPDHSFLNSSQLLNTQVSVIRDNNIERNHLRNLALKHATGSHVMYLDDDTILLPHRGLLKQVRQLKEGELLTFAERIHLPIGQDVSRFCEVAAKRRWSPSVRHLKKLNGTPEREAEFYTAEISFPTNFCIIHRTTLNQIEGLDELYTGWGYEDVDFANRVLQHGKIHCCRETATAIHISHHIDPERGKEAYINYQRFIKKCRENENFPRWSAMYFGVASRFLKSFNRYRAIQIKNLDKALRRIKHFNLNPKDCEYVAEHLHNNFNNIDVLAITVSGSAAYTHHCRDVDLCVIAGYCEDSFSTLRMPSGKELELQVTSLPSIRRQIRMLYYLGDNAILLFSKFKNMQFIYDYKRISSRYIRSSLSSDIDLLPYLYSYYVGAATLYLEKKQTAEQLSLGRFMSALAELSRIPSPSRHIALDTIQAHNWLKYCITSISPIYKKQISKTNKKRVLLYPPNILGDRILRSST